MTVEESKALRKALESDILILLQQFQSDTGLQPVEVTLQHLNNHVMGLPQEWALTGVAVRVIL